MALEQNLDLTEIDQRTEVFSSVGWATEKISNATVMVIGAGALGNEVLKNLTILGIGQILIVDFDIIENTNLAKSVLYRNSDCSGDLHKVDIAAKRLKEINPDVKIKTINGDFGIDVIIDGKIISGVSQKESATGFFPIVGENDA